MKARYNMKQRALQAALVIDRNITNSDDEAVA